MDSFFKQVRTDESGTVSIDESTADIIVLHSTASAISSLTIPFPVYPVDRQLFGVLSVKGINSLTLTSSKTINTPATMLFAGGFAWWMYCETLDQWVRFG